MKTVAEIIAWLNSPSHIKCILVDILEVRNQANTQDTAFYFSNLPYSIEYNPTLQSGVSFTESLSSDANISISYGTLELDNTGGHSDSFLTYVWKRRPIKIYLGDPNWLKSDFVLIFDGLVEDLVSTNENTLSISLVDKMQKLNDVLQLRALKDLNYTESTSASKENVLPLLFGEAFNFQPMYIDNGSTANTGKIYKIHDGSLDEIIEVRDNGVPIPVTKNLGLGQFETLSNPVGTLTCSARANNVNNCTVPELIKIIVKNYGTQTNRFVDADIDFSGITNTSKVGLYCSDRINILEACNQLAKSINAGLVCSSISITGTNVNDYEVTTSKLKLIELKTATGQTSKWNLSDDYMVMGSLSISETFVIKPTIKLAYCKNYTIQQTVADGVNPASTFNDEYLYITNTLSIEQTLYRDTGSVQEEITLLLDTSEATTEAQKRSQLWGTQRFLVTATYLPQFIFVQLGDVVTITSSRFNLNSGKQGIVYSITRNWLTGLVDIGVLV